MYLKNLESSIDRILSNFNIDPNSLSKGSFDRYFWGWKYKDFQDSSLIYSYLVLKKLINLKKIKINEDYFDNIVLENILNIQHKNGSFDQSYPNELHPKIGYDFSELLFILLKDKNKKINSKYFASYKLLIDYSLKDENYGLISNHLCHHMYEIYLAFILFKEKKYYNEFQKILNKLEISINIEGGLVEYHSFDPGYQTRSLRYLTKVLNLLKGNDYKRCLNLCKKSINFLNHSIMPDGTIYSMFGSRNTELIYPSGIEFMHKKFNDKKINLAYRIRYAITNNLTKLPISLDYNNFIRLFDDYIDSSFFYKKNNFVQDKQKSFFMKDYGLEKKQLKKYSIFIHHKFGGAFVIYKDKKMIYRNAGLLFQSGNKYYGSRTINFNSYTTINNNKKINIKLNIIRSIDRDLNPYLFILIRFLNITFFRLSILSDLLKKIIVRTIIHNKKNKNYGIINRTINLYENKIVLKDQISFSKKITNIYRVSYMHLFHTSSSRYNNILNESFESIEKIKSTKKNLIKNINIK